MSQDRAPAFQFYPRDFASDGRVEAMSAEEVGAYVLLLCKAWFEDPIGSLPNDDVTLSRWARIPRAKWSKIREKVLAPFSIASDGRYHQKRMQAVAREQDEYKATLTDRARRGAAARWGGEDAKAMLKHSLSNASSSSSATASASAPSFGTIDWAEVDSMDVEKFVSYAIQTANGGMIAAGIEFKPILGSHGSRQNVFDWVESGVSRRTIIETVYECARKVKKQISSMKYFDNLVTDAGERAKAAIPPESPAGKILAGNNEKPQDLSKPRNDDIAKQIEKREKDAIGNWKREHPDELEQLRAQAESQTGASPNGLIKPGSRTAQRIIDGLVDGWIRQRISA